MIKGQWLRGSDNLKEAYDIRKSVFRIEQNVPAEIEMDTYDQQSQHLIVYEKDTPIATGRLTEIETGMFKLSRIAVLQAYRGQGIGDFMMRMMVRRAFDYGAKEVFANVQESAVSFYSKLGFLKEGDPYEVAGITHVRMVRKQDIGGCCSH